MTSSASATPYTAGRAVINRANSKHSTGPRTEAGKQRSSLNALTHGLTAAKPSSPPKISPPIKIRDAAAILELHKHKGLPYDPAQDGFDFSKAEIEEFAQRTMRLNQAWQVEPVILHGARTPESPLLWGRMPSCAWVVNRAILVPINIRENTMIKLMAVEVKAT